MASFVSSIRYYIIYMRLWGCYPVRINEDELVPSRACRVLHILAVLLIFVLSETANMESTDEGTLAFVVELVWRSSVIGLMILWARLAWRTAEFCSIYQMLHKVDKLLTDNEVRPNFWAMTTFGWVWTGTIHVVVVVINVAELFWPMWLAAGPVRYWYLQAFFTIQVVTLSSVTFFYWTVAYRFQLINDKLRNLAPPDGSAVLFKQQAFASRLQAQIGQLSLYNGKFPQIIGVQGFVHYETIEDLQRCHFLLSTACTDMLCIYSWPLLLELTHSTLEFACNVFKTAGIDPDDVTTTVILVACKWGTLSLIRFLVIVVPLSCVTIKANDTWEHVSRLIIAVKDSKVNRQLELFALQLSRPLEFRPLTTFTINMELFLSMIAAVITYVVILLQLTKTLQ